MQEIRSQPANKLSLVLTSKEPIGYGSNPSNYSPSLKARSKVLKDIMPNDRLKSKKTSNYGRKFMLISLYR